MGCDFSVNVGPMVIISNPPVNTVVTEHACCNQECRKFHKTIYSGFDKKFCEECGSPIQEWSENVLKSRDIDFYELLEERLVPTDNENRNALTVVLVPNVDVDSIGFQSFNLKYEPFAVYPAVEEIAGNVEKFKTLFEKELNILKDIFGDTAVNVKYGVVGTITC